MDKKLILAVAGSGKTHTLCNSINYKKRNLILAFTKENIKNIHLEFLECFKKIPENTKILTFHSFLFRNCIRPYHKMICSLYGEKPFKCEGLTFKEPPKSYNNGKYNRNYVKINKLQHYVSYKNYYCSRMAKLIIKNDKTLLPVVINRINKFYDAIYIDEYQDFRNEEYDFLSILIKNFNGDVLLVGDYYQHSVSGKNNTGKPFGKANKTITYQEYKEIIEKDGIIVDETSLYQSRRCSKSVCDFVKTKLNIKIEPYDDHDGKVIMISDISEAERVLSDDSICKLQLKDSKKYLFKGLNWSYSKGDTYDKICVILTKNISNMDDTFKVDDITPIIRNKLYVALTRSRGDVYLMPDSVFDKVKNKYYKC